MSVSRQLTFDYLGKCDYRDACVFDGTYKADIYRAQEAEIYRVMDPYTEGLIKEEYAENGWMGTPAPYVQFAVDANGQITYEPFCTGMMVNAKYTAYAYYPGEYIWGKDFSEYNKGRIRSCRTRYCSFIPFTACPNTSTDFSTTELIR